MRIILSKMKGLAASLVLCLAPWRGRSFLDKVLSVILVVAILGAIGAVGYVIARPEVGERFTEFYILGPEGKAENYPKELVVGEETGVLVGIINREREIVNYYMEVQIDGVRNNQMGPLELGHDVEWEEIVSFTPYRVGNNQKVEFLLYKNGQSEPYLEPLCLWVNVED